MSKFGLLLLPLALACGVGAEEGRWGGQELVLGMCDDLPAGSGVGGLAVGGCCTIHDDQGSWACGTECVYTSIHGRNAQPIWTSPCQLPNSLFLIGCWVGAVTPGSGGVSVPAPDCPTCKSRAKVNITACRIADIGGSFAFTRTTTLGCENSNCNTP